MCFSSCLKRITANLLKLAIARVRYAYIHYILDLRFFIRCWRTLTKTLCCVNQSGKRYLFKPPKCSSHSPKKRDLPYTHATDTEEEPANSFSLSTEDIQFNEGGHPSLKGRAIFFQRNVVGYGCSFFASLTCWLFSPHSWHAHALAPDTFNQKRRNILNFNKGSFSFGFFQFYVEFAPI